MYLDLTHTCCIFTDSIEVMIFDSSFTPKTSFTFDTENVSSTAFSKQIGVLAVIGSDKRTLVNIHDDGKIDGLIKTKKVEPMVISVNDKQEIVSASFSQDQHLTSINVHSSNGKQSLRFVKVEAETNEQPLAATQNSKCNFIILYERKIISVDSTGQKIWEHIFTRDFVATRMLSDVFENILVSSQDRLVLRDCNGDFIKDLRAFQSVVMNALLFTGNNQLVTLSFGDGKVTFWNYLSK